MAIEIEQNVELKITRKKNIQENDGDIYKIELSSSMCVWYKLNKEKKNESNLNVY